MRNNTCERRIISGKLTESKMTSRLTFENYLPPCKRFLLFLTVLTAVVFASQSVSAHQSPTTLVFLDVSPEQTTMELQMPLGELESAFGHEVSKNKETLVERLRPQLSEYLLAHIYPTAADGQPWSVAVTTMKVGEAEQTQSGPYQEITVSLVLTPPVGADARAFTLNYDVIMHQVVTHSALVAVRSDWETGKTAEQPTGVGLIRVDTATTRIYPLEINLAKGGWWNGFKGMVGSGIQHIREGIDHLLFLLVLLLPATLLVKDKQWRDFGGTRYSLIRLLKIVTAFTVGHSITLLVGALGWLRLPTQPVEILIAVSILVSAVHAVRPIFPGRESFVAAGFGLVHGLAFATVLSGLHLGAGPMALSILGFNLGIELMQLLVIALIVPWLILLNLTGFYKWIRIGGAVFAAVAAVAWIAERVSGTPNAVGGSLQNIFEHAHLGILTLALIALAAFGWQYHKNKKYSVKSEQ